MFTPLFSSGQDHLHSSVQLATKTEDVFTFCTMTTSIFLVHGILYSNGASFSRLRIFPIVILSTLQRITRSRIKNIFCITTFYLSQISLPPQTSLYMQGCLFQCFMKSLGSKFLVILLPWLFCHLFCVRFPIILIITSSVQSLVMVTYDLLRLPGLGRNFS